MAVSDDTKFLTETLCLRVHLANSGLGGSLVKSINGVAFKAAAGNVCLTEVALRLSSCEHHVAELGRHPRRMKRFQRIWR